MQYGNFTSIEKKYNTNNRFKSYYVVWKPGVVKNALSGKKSLNRTMQYGNRDSVDVYGWAELCLNRTMQYGN